VRQLLTESALLAVMGGALGLVFAAWGTNALATNVAAGPVTLYSLASSWVSFDLHVNGRALALTVGICLLTVILFGLAPACRGSKVSFAPILTGRGATADGSGGRFRLGKLLVIAQVALSLMALIGAGLFVRTLRNLEAQDLGFARSHVLLVWTQPGPTGRRGPALAEFWHTVQERISSLPGVLSASASNTGVLNGSQPINVGIPWRVEGPAPKPTSLPGARAFIAPRFFETVGIPLVAGRDFSERDTATAPRVVIINESMARYYFGDQNPVGRRIGFPGEPAGTLREIVGVVKDFTIGTPRGSGQKLELSFFSYHDREATDPRMGGMCIVVRTADGPASIAARVRQELREIDPNLPVLKIATINEQLGDVLAQESLIAGLATCFGLVALLLACLGLYGVMAYTTARRTNEIGIRMALGADRRDVLNLILRQGMTLALLGVALGLAGAYALTKYMGSRINLKDMLYGVQVDDPLTYGLIAVLLTLVALVACFIPARRASKVDPMVALRYE
jgi:predicted permease